MKSLFNKIAIVVCLLLANFVCFAQTKAIPKELLNKIQEGIDAGDIPGISIAIVQSGKDPILLNLGVKSVESEEKVNSQTLFEIGSCSKSFTALAILQLEKEGKVDLDVPVSRYIPWLKVKYDGKPCDISLNQLLHHTSGIPFKTISGIPASNDKDALEKTVRTIKGIELANSPGTTFEYATINYDVIGLVIEKVSNLSFEDYMRDEVMIPLGLTSTQVGWEGANKNRASGHKIGFFSPRVYQAPYFRGNAPAGYIVSNGENMVKWLQAQIGLTSSSYDSLINKTHNADLSVPPIANFSYALGWKINPYVEQQIFHEGNNPNFSSHVIFSKNQQFGVVVLANSNSASTPLIAESIFKYYLDYDTSNIVFQGDSVDSIASVMLIIFGVFTLFIIVLIVWKLIRKDKTFQCKGKDLLRFVVWFLVGTPYFAGIYLVPDALLGFSWDAVFIWGSVSLKYMFIILSAGIGLTYVYYLLTLLFPTNNRYRNSLPLILMLSILAGLANTVVLFIITSSFYSPVSLGYLLFYFGLAYGLYVIGAKTSQTRMIQLTNELTLDIRNYLINKISRTQFEKFEKLSDGRILATLNGDTGEIANSANVVITFVTQFITILSAFIYMTTISATSTLVVLSVVVLLVWYYYMTSKRARINVEESRSITNTYMSLLNNLIYGFKELSISRKKRHEFKSELIHASEDFKTASIAASIEFLNTAIIGNSFIMIVLGILSIVVPRMSMDVNVMNLISFVMILLYIIGPINIVLSTIQAMTSVRVSWDRIRGVIHEVAPETGESISFWEMVAQLEKQDHYVKEEEIFIPDVQKIEIKDLCYTYSKTSKVNKEEVIETFEFGPINMTIDGQDRLFIIGGNGSGKSTFVKLLTGLYTPISGSISVNGERVSGHHLGEFFSVIFSGEHLFKKIYGIEMEGREGEIDELITKLQLKDKVAIENNSFTTVDLSGGQRKRLALMKCYLENKKVFVFDEFAADQDPEFRNYFYTHLLPDLKENGNIVIAITHDDNYFQTADKIVKFNYGKMESLKEKEVIPVEK